MKPSFLFIFAFITSGSIWASQDKSLEYVFGNQIKGSHLIIYKNGSIQKQERTCCPPSTKQWPPFSVDEAGMTIILNAVTDLPRHKYSSFESGNSNPGSSGGSLYLFDNAGTPILVRSIERGPTEMSPRLVRFNESPAANEVEMLVNQIVDVKMNY